MNFQKFANSRYGVQASMWLGEHLSPARAERFSWFVARQLAQRKTWNMPRAVRLNQWMVSGRTLQGEALQRATEAVFAHTGRCISDLYRVLRSPEAIKRSVSLDGFLSRWIEISRQKRGIFVVAPHMSNFDLVLQAAAWHGLEITALAYGQPTGGYDLQNEMRRRAGIRIVLARGRENEQQVIDILRRGGMVVTGIDRPIRRKRHTLHFFGQPAPLPAGHIRMALAADAELMVAAPYLDEETGLYGVEISEPFDLIRSDDPHHTLVRNAERTLSILETFIRRRPHQWLMFYPVWPQFLDEVDKL